MAKWKEDKQTSNVVQYIEKKNRFGIRDPTINQVEFVHPRIDIG